ncbi:hypothetical protein MO973_24335 [Paenibacillus sp. TRM 82003]|nr:hypothetical protein [Paenibacillus sp. TRM 82003]MCI3923359.1 hypothetical protein [Paenibacillus sp. TRM 82003]
MSRSQGHRLRMLEERHGYLEKALVEKVWWPAFGTLEGLHPEYEVLDYDGGRRYIDLAYKPETLRIGSEADGREKYASMLERGEHTKNGLRDLHLTADRWTVLHVTYDMIHFHAREVQQLLQQIVWGREARIAAGAPLSLLAREALRYGQMRGGIIEPYAFCEVAKVTRNTVYKIMKELRQGGWVVPSVREAKRVYRYEVTQKGRDLIL